MIRSVNEVLMSSQVYVYSIHIYIYSCIYIYVIACIHLKGPFGRARMLSLLYSWFPPSTAQQLIENNPAKRRSKVVPRVPA